MEWIDKIFKSYPFGPLVQITKAGGTANLNWIVQTKEGKFFLKCRRPEYSIKEHIIFESAFQNYLARKDLPVFPPLKTKEEKDFVILKNRVYQLYSFIVGDKFCQERRKQLIEVAKILSRFHSVATSFSPPVVKKLPRYDDPKIIRRKLEEVNISTKGKEKKEAIVRK